MVVFFVCVFMFVHSSAQFDSLMIHLKPTFALYRNYVIYINGRLSVVLLFGAMKNVRKKYAIKSNVPWLELHWRTSKKPDQNQCVLALNISSLLWFIYSFYSPFSNASVLNDEEKLKRPWKTNKQHWTKVFFFLLFSWTKHFIYISMFYRTHMLDTTFVSSCVCFLCVCVQQNNDKNETWMNESKWLSVISLLYNFLCAK